MLCEMGSPVTLSRGSVSALLLESSLLSHDCRLSIDCLSVLSCSETSGQSAKVVCDRYG